MNTIAESTRFPTSEDMLRPDAPLPAAASAKSATPPVSGELMNRVVQGAHDTIDRLAGQAAPHVQRLEEKIAGADELLHDRADQLRETGDLWVGRLRDNVREHPLAAVGAALALGLLIARLTR